MTDSAEPTTDFVPVADLADLETAAAAGPAVVYLHDPWCPVSARAKRELSRVGGEMLLVDVSAHPNLSREVEAWTGVRHESPQVIVLADGRPVWDGSHYAITRDAVSRVVGHLAPANLGADGEPT